MTAAIVSIAMLLTNPTPIQASMSLPGGVEGVSSSAAAIGDTVVPPRWADTWLPDTQDLSQISGSEPAPEPAAEQPMVDTTPRSLSDAQLYRLRMCESTDRYGIDTGNGYLGAYQFDLKTWNGVAANHLPWLVGVRPNHAWPAEQDAMTRWLWSERGGAPWPVCQYRIGAA